MLGISEEEYKHYLNEQLGEAIDSAIIDEEYDEIKGLIANGKLLPISNQIYDLLFFDGYPMSPKLSHMMENDNLQDVVSFFIKHVPKDFLCAEEPQDNTPFITSILHHRQDLIPNLLKIISESGRNDITFGLGDCFPKTHQAREAIEKYCTKNDDGSYKVVPGLSAIKGKSQELQQCFKDILDKVERTHKINVDSVNEALCMLAKKAQSNKEIMHAISNCQRGINFTMVLENTDATPPSGSIENTSATPPSNSIRKK